jgi:hypothetical protein
VEKGHVKQLDSNSKSNTTNAKEVVEAHFVETSNVYAIEKVDHRFGFCQNHEVLASSSNRKDLDNLWVLDLSATQHVTRNSNIISRFKYVIVASMTVVRGEAYIVVGK